MTDENGATITATFATRREAELAIERLVQELGIERTDIFVVADGVANSAGIAISGADAESGHTDVAASGRPALAGSITMSIDLNDVGTLPAVRDALEELGGEDIASE